MLKYADKQGRPIRRISLTSLLSVLQISIFYSVSYHYILIILYFLLSSPPNKLHENKLWMKTYKHTQEKLNRKYVNHNGLKLRNQVNPYSDHVG